MSKRKRPNQGPLDPVVFDISSNLALISKSLNDIFNSIEKQSGIKKKKATTKTESEYVQLCRISNKIERIANSFEELANQFTTSSDREVLPTPLGGAGQNEDLFASIIEIIDDRFDGIRKNQVSELANAISNMGGEVDSEILFFRDCQDEEDQPPKKKKKQKH